MRLQAARPSVLMYTRVFLTLDLLGISSRLLLRGRTLDDATEHFADITSTGTGTG
jgi:hypothetical protein